MPIIQKTTYGTEKKSIMPGPGQRPPIPQPNPKIKVPKISLISTGAGFGTPKLSLNRGFYLFNIK
jgi:hypothetical protein